MRIVFLAAGVPLRQCYGGCQGAFSLGPCFVMRLKNYIIVLAALMMLTSCSKEQGEQNEIFISGFENQKYDFAALALNTDSRVLSLEEEDMPITDIRDMYVSDSVLLVCDDYNTLSLFDVRTGRIIKQRNDVGHSQREYIDVCAVSGYGDYLYALDRAGRKMIQYDRNLNFIRSTGVDFLPLDFEALPDGFLFSRLDAFENEKRYILSSLSGERIGEFVAANKFEEMIYSEKSFASDGQSGYAYLHEPMRNEIYYTDGKDIYKKYDFIFKTAENNEATVLRDCFVTSKKIIGTFINDEICYSFIYNISNKECKAGVFDMNSHIPFSPMSQNGDVLYAVYHNEDLADLDNWNGEDNDRLLTLYAYHF